MPHHKFGWSARAALLGCLAVGSLCADSVCTGGTSQITGANTTFCVAATGYSNQWFSTNPAPTINPNQFNLLGDSAQFLSYHLLSGPTVSQWLNPTVGSISDTGTTFSATGPVTQISPSEVLSAILDTNVRIDTDSKVIQDNIKQTFTITNIGGDTIDWVQLVQYLHYFPYGQANPTLGTLTYEPVPTIEDTYVFGLWGSGQFGQPGFVGEGGACGGPGAGPGIGCSTPDHYLVGTPGDVLAAVGTSGTTPLVGGTSSAGMDAAGALSWRVSDLSLTQANGQSVAFTIELVPEPASFALMLMGGAGLWFRRRRL